VSDPGRPGYEFGPFRLEGTRRLLLRDGRQVRLSGKAFDILLLLLEERGRLVEKDELMQRVWPNTVVEENNLTVNISALRKALGERPDEHRYLVTVPGRGYQFVADVRESDGHPAVPPIPTAPMEPAAPPSPSPSPPPRRWRGALLVGAVLLSVAIVALRVAHRRPPVGAGPAGLTSLAVLPFTTVGDAPDVEYLSEGISEGLISRLSQLPGVKVTARDSAFRYRGKDVALTQVAHDLGVEAILTGRVTQRGQSLWISVELVNAGDQTQVWGEQYHRQATDLLALQSEMAGEIADRLRVRLTTGDRQQLARRVTVDPRAYELLLRGRFHFNKGSNEARTRALEYFVQAVAIDPGYAPVYAELANAYSILGNDGVIDPREAMSKAEAAAVKALELDEGLAEAHRALAYNRQLAWDWAGGERAYRRAIALSPNYAEAHAYYSGFLSLLRRHEEAFAEARRAKELDPFSLRIDIWVFNSFYQGRQFDRALDILRQMRELEPNHPLTAAYAGYAYEAMGRYTEAVAAYEEGIRLSGPEASASDRIFLGSAYARVGRQAEAQALLRELQSGTRYVSPAELSVLHIALGEKDLALRSLEKAYAAHDLQLQYVNADPHFDELRGDARFLSLLRRVGFPP
jgi:DNA-binding winged helix-turn-helix (wHTH) protein/TolB-like protein/Tfp pilus assembly protein PilF